MPMTHLAGVDLNLLPLLDALLGERHVTRAAERVGLSQPAASRGLGRLRVLLDDPLLVRAGTGLALTPRAEAVRDPVRRALGIVEGAIAKPATFDPAVARRTVRIVTDDYSGFVLLPRLVERLTRTAPGFDVWAVPAGGSLGVEPLVRGDIDFLIAPLGRLPQLPPGIRVETLFSERFMCVVQRGHPLARKATLERFVAARHAFVAPGGSRGGPVDDALAGRGKERRIALALPHFLVMPFVVAASDLVLTVGERVARTYAGLLPITVFEPPLAVPGFTVGMFWHEKVEHDPALGWFRGEMSALARGLGSGGRPARRASRGSRIAARSPRSLRGVALTAP
jgi:DNA-binding transcriptional LysR family regulator